MERLDPCAIHEMETPAQYNEFRPISPIQMLNEAFDQLPLRLLIRGCIPTLQGLIVILNMMGNVMCSC
jgi:hypothetical protein